ncbi:MAG TPA: heavy metal translocating P-type ATPase [Candidatus Eisenbacteria bacterium]|nr:heavy metal translocating P-type ATPase [Candidatus Eisenbacteria bacterium]
MTTAAAAATKPPRKLSLLASADWQMGLTALCAIAGLAGAGVGRAGGDPAWRIALYAVSYLAGGWGPTRDLLANLLRGQLDINLLMIAAAAGSAALGHWGEGAILLFLFSLSGTLEGYTMERTARSIESLIELRPDTALVVRDGRETRLPIESIGVGERVRTLPGERFAVDGTIEEGETAADESTLTGESAPVTKRPGDRVFAGTLNAHGAPLVRVEKMPGETTISKIVQMVQEAGRAKSTAERFVDRWQRTYVIAVFAGAALAALLPLLILHAPWSEAWYRGLVLLVAASPCAVVIASPAAMLSAITHAARHGVLFKGSIHLERLGEVGALAMDKTGTVTEGKPRLTDIRVVEGELGEEDLLALAASIEARSEHHTARAVRQEAERRGLRPSPLSEFESHSGEGVHGHSREYWVGVGREPLFARHGVPLSPALLEATASLRSQGKTALIVVVRRQGNGARDAGRSGPDGLLPGGEVAAGVLAVADVVRPRARDAIAACRGLGVGHIAMLTGDHASVAASIGAEIGVDEVRAGLLPEQKVTAIRELKAKWPTLAMVGDGVNDAPALAAASVGIAMGGAGTDVALDTADVVLMRDDLKGIPFSLWLARRARRVVTQSLTFAFCMIGLLVITTLLGFLPLWLAVVCHEGSTLLVIANGVRLLGEPHPDFDLA